ncbi:MULTISPECIES: helix-hairpin-helix domain-containing protein [unclassified Methylobacterium]|uniref:ComEA family DNA-binding protein n=1 Tax=unclassified Methylobacterium TaxID=2615210 RepID=UPI0036FC7C31
MLSGSAILRVLLLIVAAAGIAGIIQHVWLGGPASTPTPPAAGSAETGRTKASAAPPQTGPVRVVTPAEPPRSEAPQAAPQSAVQAAPQPAPAPPPPAAPPVPQPSAVPAPAPPEPDPVAEAEENAPAPAIALVDLNTATLAELNGLKGGGAIGRTVIQHRPYASVDQLLSKRVLNRATYQRIKDQVIVR